MYKRQDEDTDGDGLSDYEEVRVHRCNPLLKDSDRDGLNAVSYTHLRAHETVLDLVCRLLLEKKKAEHPPTMDRVVTRQNRRGQSRCTQRR